MPISYHTSQQDLQEPLFYSLLEEPNPAVPPGVGWVGPWAGVRGFAGPWVRQVRWSAGSARRDIHKAKSSTNQNHFAQKINYYTPATNPEIVTVSYYFRCKTGTFIAERRSRGECLLQRPICEATVASTRTKKENLEDKKDVNGENQMDG